MALINCSHHGYAGGERVTKTLAGRVNDRATWSSVPELASMSILFDEIEFPVYGVIQDGAAFTALGGVDEGNGNYRVPDEETLGSALDLMTVVCVRCLREMAGEQMERIG